MVPVGRQGLAEDQSAVPWHEVSAEAADHSIEAGLQSDGAAAQAAVTVHMLRPAVTANMLDPN